jgi:hypothetical protein
MFLKPHFEMLSKLDRNVVILQNHALGNYLQHGIGGEPDRSQKILKEYFPNVEVYRTKRDITEFSAELYNEGLEMMQDCDLVLRLDPDMFFLEKDFDDLLNVLQNVDSNCFRMDFRKDSINYYMTWDYEHGLKDSKEMDPLVVNPKYFFTSILDYPDPNQVNISLPDWVCHHLRGWNKPLSVPNNWIQTENSRKALESTDDKKWHTVPDEIREKLESWREELKTI